MDLQDQRMQCLKMAFELHGNPDTVLAAAQRMLDFVTGSTAVESTTDIVVPNADTIVDDTPVDGPVAALVAAEASIADPIAACGTALVMPEGGNLEDAVSADVVAVEVAAETIDAAAIEASMAEAPAVETEAEGVADGVVFEIADDRAVDPTAGAAVEAENAIVDTMADATDMTAAEPAEIAEAVEVSTTIAASADEPAADVVAVAEAEAETTEIEGAAVAEDAVVEAAAAVEDAMTAEAIVDAATISDIVAAPITTADGATADAAPAA